MIKRFGVAGGGRRAPRAPLPGEHSDELLAEAGLSTADTDRTADIAALHDAGVVA